MTIKTLTVRLDDELHKQFKILSINLGKDMQELILEQIKKLLEEQQQAG